MMLTLATTWPGKGVHTVIYTGITKDKSLQELKVTEIRRIE
jgi:hypothetical protein